MNIRSIFAIIVLFVSTVCNSYCQEDKELQIDFIMGGGESTLLDDATWYFDMGDFEHALDLFQKLDKKYPGSNTYKYFLGRCYLEIPNLQEKAIENLEKAYSKEPDLNDILFYLGKAYKVNYKFNEAIGYFKLADGKKTSEDNRKLIPRMIEQCHNAKEILSDSLNFKVELTNIGAPINTEADEYVPLVPADESILIYTYKGKKSMGGLQNIYGEPDPDGAYYEDIYISSKLDNSWQEPNDLSSRINSKYHDASIALSPDGKTLFTYKDVKGGDIYISKNNKNVWYRPKPLLGDVNTKYYEGHASISLDGQSLYFISNRPGGFGGNDIYRAKLQEDDTWGEVINLGVTINSKYDEDAPFINTTGRLLYFSSKGHKNMGGYDIFYSSFEQNAWLTPINIGPPVNTTNDDNFYVISQNGERAYFSSLRKGGLGGQDIYFVEPGIIGDKPVQALLNGIIQKDGLPIEITIKVTNNLSNEIFGTYNSDSVTGKYLIAIPPGGKYRLDFVYSNSKTKDLDSNDIDIAHTEFIDLTNLKYFVEVNQDFNFNDDLSASNDLIQKQIDHKINKDGILTEDIVFLDTSEEGSDQIDTTAMQQNNLISMETDISDSLSISDTVEISLIEPGIESESESLSGKTQEADSEIEKEDKINSESKDKSISEKEFKNILFDFDNQSLRSESKKVLDDLLDYLQDNPNLQVEIAGHSDAIGTKTYNKELSGKRAKSAAKYLIGKGINPNRISVFAFGKEKPLSPNTNNDGSDNKTGRQNNRRVEFSTNGKFSGSAPGKLITMSTNSNNDKLLNNPSSNNNIFYKVQVAAYKYPENYNGKILQELGDLDHLVKDGITRFTLGRFTNLKEARKVKNLVIEKGVSDAFITAEVNGERKYLNEINKMSTAT